MNDAHTYFLGVISSRVKSEIAARIRESLRSPSDLNVQLESFRRRDAVTAAVLIDLIGLKEEIQNEGEQLERVKLTWTPVLSLRSRFTLSITSGQYFE